MQVEINPLKALHDAHVSSLFAKMLAHRYRTDILSDYYRLPGIPNQFSWWGQKVTPKVKAEKELEFLKKGADFELGKLQELVQEFWNDLRPQGNHLHEHLKAEDAYNKIAVFASDIKLIKPLFYLFPDHEALEIADIGAGRNQLGNAILKYFDALKGSNAAYFNWFGHLGGPTVSGEGTDVAVWDDADAATDQPFGFKLQPSDTEIPLKADSKDVVITKWCFHHMKPWEMDTQITNIYKILRPGGVVIVIEAFLSKRPALPQEHVYPDIPEPSFAQRLLEVSRRVEFADIWPDGPWKDECYQISSEYLALTPETQHSILALEDFFGHYVLNKREKMQFPFSYVPAEDLIEKFTGIGFVEQRWNFLLFGLAPIIRRGPPSARFIFQKPSA
jgi:SAM-dependent methyltransferase